MTSSESDHRPDAIRCIGSSYLVNGSPGHGCVGGLEVQIASPSNIAGVLKIEATLWPDNRVVAEAELSRELELAIRGLQDYADSSGFSLTDYDIVLRRFFVNDAESMGLVYYAAAQKALESSLNAWNGDLPPTQRNTETGE